MACRAASQAVNHADVQNEASRPAVAPRALISFKGRRLAGRVL